MAGSGRQYFEDNEKASLQELIIKYKPNSTATGSVNMNAKKATWTSLTEEYNSIETNKKRTEAQLKKCWDNLKTRRKFILAQQKRERMRTGGGSYNINAPSTSNEAQLMDDALAEPTDVELVGAIDSDTLFDTADEQLLHDMPATTVPPAMTVQDENLSSVTERDTNIEDIPAVRPSVSRLTDYSTAPSQGSRNICTKVIEEEFLLRQKSYESTQRREEVLHTLKIKEREWMVKAAEEMYLKSKAEREAAEELHLCNRAKREEAELRLAMIKNKK